MFDDNVYGLLCCCVMLLMFGVVLMMDCFGVELLVVLVVLLYVLNDVLCDELVLFNKKYLFCELMVVCQCYLKVVLCDFIIFEYCMFDGVNDIEVYVCELLVVMCDVLCKFNLILFNLFLELGFICLKLEQIKCFVQVFIDVGVVMIVCKMCGDDIDVVCGQLVGVVKDCMCFVE